MLPHEALRVDRLLLRLLEPHQHLDDVLGDARLDQVLPEVGFLWTSRALRTELLSAWWGGRGGEIQPPDLLHYTAQGPWRRGGVSAGASRF